uniref:Uncharacterized protein n=1 Tax=Setaria italica TaxID=4555 RepID=K4ANZ7_SETIT
MKLYPSSNICSGCMLRNLRNIKLLGSLTEAYADSFVVDVDK